MVYSNRELLCGDFMRPSQIVWVYGALHVNDQEFIPAGDWWAEKLRMHWAGRPWEKKYTWKENAKLCLFCIVK